jgi:hypothetical protein
MPLGGKYARSLLATANAVPGPGKAVPAANGHSLAKLDANCMVGYRPS